VEVEQTQEGPAQGWTWAAPPPPPPPPAAGPAAIRTPAGVPARGRGTQFDPVQADRATGAVAAVATTPLARPTGYRHAIDSFHVAAGDGRR
jgi:hypothetical protein